VSQLRTWGLPTLVISAIIYATLVATDVLVFALITPNPPFHQGLYQIDENRGYSHTPGFSGVVHTTDDFSVTINSHGYRDREWAFDAPHRIMVVGDSFTFGEPLAEDQTIFANLQNRFEPAEVAFYNAGVSGYGLAQVLATVEKECAVVRPERVLYLFYLNDTRRGALRTDTMTVADGWLVPAFDPEFVGRRLSDQEILDRIDSVLASQKLHVIDILKLKHMTDVLRRSGFLGRPDGVGAPQTPFETDDVANYPPEISSPAAEILRAMADAADQCGAEFTMVILASDLEMRLDVREPATESLLEEVAADSLDILDLRSPSDPTRVLRLPNDNHYNADAAAWAAKRIAEHLRPIGSI
jgi:hypothetical protein